MRKPMTFRLDFELLERARRHAIAENRSLANYVETAVLREVEQRDSILNGQARKIAELAQADTFGT
ncbi:hypothetical protein WG901_22255 [Novosphingobium sp. PS1R-30]|uniref:Toxin-antitoxin system HicB family antitoxin n=1 Tax=Novosphingobium anseongense TaxID=3133436 RepID=A0ABU8S1Z8_9SPHN